MKDLIENERELIENERELIENRSNPIENEKRVLIENERDLMENESNLIEKKQFINQSFFKPCLRFHCLFSTLSACGPNLVNSIGIHFTSLPFKNHSAIFSQRRSVTTTIFWSKFWSKTKFINCPVYLPIPTIILATTTATITTTTTWNDVLCTTIGSLTFF